MGRVAFPEGEKARLRTVIVFLLAFPLLGIAALATRTISERRADAADAEALEERVQLAVRVGDLVHETQKERGKSSVFLTSNGARFAQEVTEQRLRSDKQLRRFRAFADAQAGRLPGVIERQMPETLALLGELHSMRARVSSLAVTPSEEMSYYTALNEQLLRLVGSIGLRTSNADLERLSTAYLALLRAKEKMGLERAQLSNVFGKDEFAPGQFAAVRALIGAQSAYLQIFADSIDPDILAIYRDRMAERMIAEIARMERIAESPTGPYGIDPTRWFAVMSAKIELLKIVEDAAALRILERAGRASDDAAGAVRSAIAATGSLFAAILVLTLILARKLERAIDELERARA